MAVEKSTSTASSGMKPEMMALLSWIFAPITSLIWMNEKDDLVRFHAKQSLYYGIFAIVMYVLTWVLAFTIILACLSFIWPLVDLGVRIYMAIQANKGEKTKLPVIGDMAEKN
jgi:uncharacterized membrane protein